MKYITVLDRAFCINHFRNRPGINELFSSDQSLVWESINRHILLQSKNILFKDADITTEELAENPILLHLLNSYAQNEKDVLIKNSYPIEQLEKEDNRLSPLFLVDETKLGYAPSAYGYIKLKSDEVANKWMGNPANTEEYLITGKKTNENALSSWNDFQQFRHHTSFVVLCDNYILKYESNIQSSIIPLLQQLLVEQPPYEINLIIITNEFYSIDKERTKQAGIKEVYKKLTDALKYRLPFARFNVTLFQKKLKKGHDRNVITNYYRLEFTNSISFFDSKGRKIGPSNVKMFVQPHIKKNGNLSFGDNTQLILDEIKEIIEEINPENIYPNHTNRSVVF